MKRILAVLCVLVVIALLLLGADRGAVWFAERQQAERLARDLDVSPPPTVKIAGIPFLTQVAAGRFQQIEIQADEMTVADKGQSITLQQVDLQFKDVRGLTSPVASRVDGNAVVSWDGVGSLIGQRASYAGDAGRIKIAYQTQFMGTQVNADVIGTPQLDADKQQLTLGDPQISVADYQLPDEVSKQVLDQLVKPVPIELALGLRLEQLTATEAGLAVVLSGSEVALAG